MKPSHSSGAQAAGGSYQPSDPHTSPCLTLNVTYISYICVYIYIYRCMCGGAIRGGIQEKRGHGGKLSGWREIIEI